MKPKISELDLHQSVADFLSWTVLPPAVWTTFPAGWTAMRTGAAGRLKACGLKAGMPDILVFHDTRTFGIELKTLMGKLSAAQIEMSDRLAKAGIWVHVCHSIDDVHETLVAQRIPLRKFSYAPRLASSESRRKKEFTQGESRAPT